MQLLPAADHRRMPWKNGKGVTIEIAIHPAGASVDDFDWRLSTATVDSDGPFSVFSGIDRSLSVLEGDGIVLTVEGRPEARLMVDSAPLTFPADAPTSARLIGGTITDLNAMSRRGRYQHRLSHHPVQGDTPVPVQGETCLIFCEAGEVVIEGQTLRNLDCLRIDHAAGALTATGDGTVYVVSFSPA